MATHALCAIPLVAPTTQPERAAQIANEAQGFVYYVMVRGVTGARALLAADLHEHVAALRAVTTLPIAVGFGISNGEQAREAAESADAVVVGSTLVRAAREGRLAALVKELHVALG
jgi:tryptophan synthase alpha chain